MTYGPGSFTDNTGCMQLHVTKLTLCLVPERDNSFWHSDLQWPYLVTERVWPLGCIIPYVSGPFLVLFCLFVIFLLFPFELQYTQHSQVDQVTLKHNIQKLSGFEVSD